MTNQNNTNNPNSRLIKPFIPKTPELIEIVNAMPNRKKETDEEKRMREERERLRKEEEGKAEKQKQENLGEFLEGDYWQIPKSRILQATHPDYRKFLTKAGHWDLDGNYQSLEFGKNVLKINSQIRDVATKLNIPLLDENDGRDYLVNINQPNSRKLVENFGCKLIPTGIMYHLIIPFLKDLRENGNSDAIATLEEMENTSTGKAEWLDDLILNKTQLQIYSQTIQLPNLLPTKDGRFDRSDMNIYGYPKLIKSDGEFMYWYPMSDKCAAFRSRGSGLDLDLGRGPSMVDDWIGVRLARLDGGK